MTDSIWYSRDEISVADLADVAEQSTTRDHYPLAQRTQQEILVYEATALRAAIRDRPLSEVLGELAKALDSGPGVVLITGAFETSVVDRASEVFKAIVEKERSRGLSGGDHYAKPGANDRVWNALEKLAMVDAEIFADYYANEFVELGALAWLGPGYHVASQINVVNPGGEAQSPHRDYHFGFFTDAQAERYAPHVHRMSPMLTLQCAVAHSDMPIDSGPTMVLPHSHKLGSGFLAWRRGDVKTYFAKHHSQVKLDKGDLMMFNPAVIHAAGTNNTPDVERMANLLQISSPFGREMETIDRNAIVAELYPVLLQRAKDGFDIDGLRRVVAACAEGYAFPTNLDRDPPLNGLAPPTEADTVCDALAARWPTQRLADALDEHRTRRLSR